MHNNEQVAHYITSLAQRAILYEVSTTPKPGLVDCNNPGAHRDMDFFTFMASASAIYEGLKECTMMGLQFKCSDKTKLLQYIRIPGVECETSMFKATRNINTHKGIIFSLGILCAVAGYLFAKKESLDFTIEELCNEVSEVCKGLTEKDFKDLDKKEKLTHGEILYIKYGYKGIRGEVENGFHTVRGTAIPVLKQWDRCKDLSKNQLFIQMLFSIMTMSEDTNVVTRGGIEKLAYVKSEANKFISLGGVRQSNYILILEDMNKNFIEENISPGGSADLLAVSIFLGLLQGVID